MAKVTGARGRRCLLYLEHLIVLSAGLNSHFDIKSEKTKQDLSYNFFKFLQDLSF